MSSEIIKDHDLQRCYQRALFHLGRRALSSYKLKEKLSKHFSATAIDHCIEQLFKKKYLDDQEYLLKKWENGKRKGHSNYALSQKLRQEGFDLNTIKYTAEQLQNEEEDLETIVRYLNSKKRSLINNLPSPESKEKVFRHLAYKGHRYNMIEKIWQKLTSEIND